MKHLLAAVMAVAEDLSLETVLHRVVESACQLVDAQYGALGVAGEDGTSLSHFITVGIDEEEHHRIGDLPTGHGVLGLLLREPVALRLNPLSGHADAHGFPPNHPPMQSFLGVPIRVRGAVFGSLYLTEKKGGGSFTVRDEEFVSTLAAAAGVAIQNARLFEALRRREQWLQASMELSMRLPSKSQDPRDLIVDHALAPAGAALAVFATPAQDGMIARCEAAAGARAGEVVRQSVPVSLTALHSVLETGKPVLCEAADLVDPEKAEGLGAALVARLSPRGGEPSLLVLCREAGADGFHPVDLDMAEIFCTHASLTMELAQGQRLREQLVLFADRDRIARDLHDVVIQRLFAAGLNLQSLRRYTMEDSAQERISDVTRELDEAIRELRDTIYSLRADAQEEVLSSRIVRAVQEGTRASAFTPRLEISGPIDSDVPDKVAEHLLAVIREGLSNAVRHSDADHIEVSVAAIDKRIRLAIEDNGRGFADPLRRSGLANLEQRAEELHGTLEIKSAPGKGTSLVWTAPLA